MASPSDHDDPQTGDAAPEFTAASSRSQTLDDSRFIGKVPFVLVFTADLQDPASARLVNDLDRHQEGFGAQRVQLLIVVPEPVDMVQQDSDQRSITAPLLADPNREIAARYGVELDGPGFARMAGKTSLLQVLVGEHPLYGKGVRSTLELPFAPDDPATSRIANELNSWELSGADLPPHFGRAVHRHPSTYLCQLHAHAILRSWYRPQFLTGLDGCAARPGASMVECFALSSIKPQTLVPRSRKNC